MIFLDESGRPARLESTHDQPTSGMAYRFCVASGLCMQYGWLERDFSFDGATIACGGGGSDCTDWGLSDAATVEFRGQRLACSGRSRAPVATAVPAPPQPGAVRRVAGRGATAGRAAR